MNIFFVQLALAFAMTNAMPQIPGLQNHNPAANMLASGFGGPPPHPGFPQQLPPQQYHFGNPYGNQQQPQPQQQWQQPGQPPRPIGLQKDINQMRAIHNSNLIAASAQASDKKFLKASEAQGAAGSQAVMSALKAKNKGNMISKGSKFEHKETKAETWDDSTNWHESYEAVDAAEAHSANGRASEVATLSDAQASNSEMGASDQDDVAIDSHLEHDDVYNHQK